MSRSQREKGKTGEREVANLISSYGYTARRDGRLDVDLVHNVPDVHFEVKRREQLRIREWWEQADFEAGSKEPILVFRQARKPWLAVVDFDFLLRLLKEVRPPQET